MQAHPRKGETFADCQRPGACGSGAIVVIGLVGKQDALADSLN